MECPLTRVGYQPRPCLKGASVFSHLRHMAAFGSTSCSVSYRCNGTTNDVARTMLIGEQIASSDPCSC